MKTERKEIVSEGNQIFGSRDLNTSGKHGSHSVVIMEGRLGEKVANSKNQKNQHGFRRFFEASLILPTFR